MRTIDDASRTHFLKALQELCKKHEVTVWCDDWDMLTDNYNYPMFQGPSNELGFMWTLDIDEILLDEEKP